jgi:hypothetical protein
MPARATPKRRAVVLSGSTVFIPGVGTRSQRESALAAAGNSACRLKQAMACHMRSNQRSAICGDPPADRAQGSDRSAAPADPAQPAGVEPKS